MAYKRSITSSHESDNNPQNSDSLVSWPSGCSKKYEWIWDSTSRAHRLPRTPTPSESSQRDEEEDFDIDETYNYMDHGDNFEAREGASLIAARMAVTAEYQRLRIEELEQALQTSQASEQSALTLTDLLAERVADLSCFNVRLGLALAGARALVKKLALAVGAVVVEVYLLFK